MVFLEATFPLPSTGLTSTAPVGAPGPRPGHGPYSRVGRGEDKHRAVGGHGLGAVFPRIIFLLLLLLFLLFWQWVWVGVFVHCWERTNTGLPPQFPISLWAPVHSPEQASSS